MEQNPELPFTVTAAAQTAGRGRQGKSFFSPANTGLYMSVADICPGENQNAECITIRVSLAVADAIEKVTGVCVGIKWVNDIYAGGLKICGILTESFFFGGKRYVIIGVGVNVGTKVFPDELRNKAGSLNIECIKSDVMSRLEQQINVNIREVLNGGFGCMEEYKKRSVILGKQIIYEKNGRAFAGCAVDITKDGALKVETENGYYDILRSGEVSLKAWNT